MTTPTRTIFEAEAGLRPCNPDCLEFILDWQRNTHAVAVRKGWYVGRDPKSADCHITMLALIAGEVHEAIEEVRDGGRIHYLGPDGKPEGVGIELADVLLRVFDYAEFCGMDLQALLETKHKYNQTRTHRHGGRLA